MKTKMIRLLFFTGNDFVSKMIRHFTKSPITHVAIQLDKWHITDARLGRKSGINHVRDYNSVYRIVDLSVTEEEYNKIIQAVHKEMDKPYDVKDLFSFIFPFIKGNKDHYICTEYVCKLLIAGGMSFTNPVLTPQEVFYAVTRQERFIERMM